MPAQRSVGRFCSVVTNDLVTLANLDAVDLGIGAEAFVLSNSRSYRLSAAVLSNASPVAIAALGGAGTWIQENAIADQTFFIYATAASSFITSVVNTWHAFPSAVSLYASSATKAFWTLDTTTGAITYNGPTAIFLASANISFVANAVAQSWEFSLTRNGAIIGTTSADPLSSRVDVDNVGFGFASTISTNTIVPAGTTYQSAFRCLDAGTGFRILKYQLCFQLLPN